MVYDLDQSVRQDAVRVKFSYCPTAEWKRVVRLELDRQATHDMNYKREQDRLDEDKKHAVVADAARKRWASLMTPYDGWRLIDIPVDVIQEADSAMQEAKTADRKWRQLMGF